MYTQRYVVILNEIAIFIFNLIKSTTYLILFLTFSQRQQTEQSWNKKVNCQDLRVVGKNV